MFNFVFSLMNNDWTTQLESVTAPFSWPSLEILAHYKRLMEKR